MREAPSRRWSTRCAKCAWTTCRATPFTVSSSSPSPVRATRCSGPKSQLRALEAAQQFAQLTTHLTRIARDIGHDVAFGVHVVTGLIPRDPQTPTRPRRHDDPRHADLACFARRHDPALSVQPHAPTGGARGADNSLEVGLR